MPIRFIDQANLKIAQRFIAGFSARDRESPDRDDRSVFPVSAGFYSLRASFSQHCWAIFTIISCHVVNEPDRHES